MAKKQLFSPVVLFGLAASFLFSGSVFAVDIGLSCPSVGSLTMQGKYIVGSNHEKIKILDGKRAGFSTDFACMVGLILLADYLDLGIVSTGTMLGSTYVPKGNKYRDFDKCGYWTRWGSIFKIAGLELAFPVGGCSEVITSKLTNESEFKDLSYSCVRGSYGRSCNECFKCFRKNLLNGKLSNISEEVQRSISKRPIHQGDSLIYAANKYGFDLGEYSDLDLSWLERYYAGSLVLVPEKLREGVRQKLKEKGINSMTNEDINKMKEYNIE